MKCLFVGKRLPDLNLANQESTWQEVTSILQVYGMEIRGSSISSSGVRYLIGDYRANVTIVADGEDAVSALNSGFLAALEHRKGRVRQVEA